MLEMARNKMSLDELLQDCSAMDEAVVLKAGEKRWTHTTTNSVKVKGERRPNNNLPPGATIQKDVNLEVVVTGKTTHVSSRCSGAPVLKLQIASSATILHL